jgi:hypothetical protein
MEEVLEILRAFVAGNLTPSEFRDRLYADERFEVFLNNDPHLRPGNYVGDSVYLYLLRIDFDDPGDILSAQGAITDFMDRSSLEYTKTSEYEDFYDLILDAQPSWLNVDAKYVQDHLLPAAGGRQGSKLREWLSEELLRRFRYIAEPPQWIQSPAWPIGPNGPLVFLGQLDVNDYFHDSAAVFVFHDPGTGTCETVIQVS